MSKTIVNLTLPTVVALIEDILETYPDHPYQQAFSIPDLRQELIAYAMSRISSCYVVVEDEQQPSVNFKSLCSFLTETSSIEAVIHKGIEKVLQKRAQQVSRQIPEEVDSGFAPSDWFG